MKGFSLYSRVARSLELQLFLVYTLLALFIYFLLSYKIRKEFDTQLIRRAYDYASQVPPAYTKSQQITTDSQYSEHPLYAFSKNTQGSFSYLLKREVDGQVLFVYDSLAERPSKSELKEQVSFVPLPNRNGRGRKVDIPVNLGFETASPSASSGKNQAILSISESYEAQDDILKFMRLALILTGLFLALCIPLSLRFSLRRSFAPLKKLSQSATELHPLSSNERLQVDSAPTELYELITSFNSLLERLSETFLREKRLGAGMSHELRTPLAELQTLQQVALRGGVDLEKSLYEGVSITERMKILMDVLNSLHNDEYIEDSLSIETVDLQELVENVLKAMPDSENRVKLEESQSMGNLETDPYLLHALLHNLIKNALDYSPPNSPVTIHRNTFSLEIENELPVDFEKSQLKKFTEPFWRADSSRKSKEHFGLGLSLCESYCKILCLKLSFSTHKNKLVSSLLFLPASTPSKSPEEIMGVLN